MASGLLKEHPIEISGDAGLLEGCLGSETAAQNGAIIALHPHPLYGGSMNNPVVETMVRAAQTCGLATLRFNFRGVGRSQGHYDEGTGEQDDIGSALDFLERSLDPGTRVLAGYSFGAAVALFYCHRSGHRVDHLVLISPPPFLLPGGVSLEAGPLRKILVGEHDEVARPEEVTARVSAARAEELIEVVPGADHLFRGKEEDLEKRLIRILNEVCRGS